MSFDAFACVVAVVAVLGSVLIGATLERGGMFDWWHGNDR
jgi:hypothetical protein